VEEEQDLGRIGVFLGQGEDVQVAMTDIEVLNHTMLAWEGVSKIVM
jgi:hypothetical protein